MRGMIFALSLFTAALMPVARAVEAPAAGAVSDAASPEQNTAPRGYRTLRLGTVQGGSSAAYALSPNGKAAGYVGFDIEGRFRPALFAAGREPRVIHTDGPGSASGVNGLGEVVGWFQQGDRTEAFRWKFNTITTLPSLGGGSSYATAINARSEIVGWSQALSSGERHAVYWYGSTLIDLGTWGGLAAEATAINRRGDIVGYREVEIDGRRVKQGVRQLKGRKPQLLRIPEGYIGLVPKAINDNGDIAGHMYGSFGEVLGSEGFLLVGNNYSKMNEQSGYTTYGLGLNNYREVSGYRDNFTSDPRDRGRVWRHRGQTIVGLDGLPSARNTGWWALGAAYAINDNGVVVGVGQWGAVDARTVEAYMLVPRE
ncbi:hypothetical protein [Azohydromonas caseinilytica]|uniref:Extracellular repeat, HAF family n=1 Tax=Azohydromonas caseinilytica TaxID=2728836 RepID=A0A848FF03_9BURK|nr:hypothetical protein [Azohydromonas caseinilytica]NML16909.1 hypothetical protein [Azohydromonas caseinilytica]